MWPLSAMSTPTEHRPMALEPPPNHFGLEVWRIHLPFGVSAPIYSPICESTHASSTTFFPDDE